MEELTYKDILLANEGLKKLREENNWTIPEGYQRTINRQAQVIAILYLIAGILVGIAIGKGT